MSLRSGSVRVLVTLGAALVLAGVAAATVVLLTRPEARPASSDASPSEQVASAEAALEAGRLDEARTLYRAVADRDPDNLDAQRRLLLLALLDYDAEQTVVAADAVLRLAPGSADAQAAAAARAVTAPETEGTAATDVVAEARAAVEAAPDSLVARWSLALALLGQGAFCEAAADLAPAIAAWPAIYPIQELRLNALGRAGDDEAVSRTLAALHERFPDRAAVTEWYLDDLIASGDADGATALLRAQAAEAPSDPGPALRLVDHLRSTAGDEAALQEIRRLAEAADGTPAADPLRLEEIRSLVALERDEAAQASLDRLQADAAAEPSVLAEARVLMAGLLRARGREAEARDLIDQVLAADPTNVAALKDRAQALLADGEPDQALSDLRTASEQEADDTSILLLLAQAYEQAGRDALANDAFARAVEISDGGAVETRAFARFLSDRGQDRAAQSVLQQATEAEGRTGPPLAGEGDAAAAPTACPA